MGVKYNYIWFAKYVQQPDHKAFGQHVITVVAMRRRQRVCTIGLNNSSKESTGCLTHRH